MDPGPQEKEGLLFAKMCHFFFGVYLLSIVNMNESGSTPAGLTSTTMVGRELPSFELLSTASLLEGGCLLPLAFCSALFYRDASKLALPFEQYLEQKAE